MDHCLGDIRFTRSKSDPCVYIYKDDAGFMTLTLYVNDFLLLGANKLLLNKLKKQLMDGFEMTDMGDVLRVFSMNVTRDTENETIAIYQRDHTKDVIDRFGTKGYNPAYMPGVEPKISLNQPETNAGQGGQEALPTHHGWCHAPWEVSHYDILSVVNQLAKVMPKPSKAHMGAVKHLLCYLAGSASFSITYKRGGSKLAA